jgi:hypothetical protein
MTPTTLLGLVFAEFSVVCSSETSTLRSPSLGAHAQASANILRVYMSGDPKWSECSLGSKGTDRTCSTVNIRDGSLLSYNKPNEASKHKRGPCSSGHRKFPNNLHHPLITPVFPSCSTSTAIERVGSLTTPRNQVGFRLG